ncbi:MAG: serine hydrolase domain-containing protein [Gemmatimonadales bacterium]
MTTFDASASDPVRLGWMVGSPPAADKLIRFADGSFFRFPQTRWAYSNLRQTHATVAVPRGGNPAVPLPRAERDDLDAVTFQPLGRSDRMSWGQSLDANFTDGIVILHRGRIVYERYFGALDPDRQHIAFSVTKSFIATIAAALVHEGALDDQAPVPHYLPELARSGFADATVRQLLDMTTGLDYTEDYTDPDSPVWEFSRAGGFLPRPPGYLGADTFYEFLATLRKGSAHGERFAYKTVNTDALGWILRRVTRQTLAELMRERLWSALGMEQDGYFLVDSVGAEFAGAGLCLTCRDLARFGEMMRQEGRWNGKQVVPKAVVDDIRRGGDRDHFALAGYELLPGWSYRNMWWVSHDEHGAYAARGIHGQTVYVDPTAEMVIARFASHPLAANANLDPTSLPAYRAVARHLMGAR